MLEKISVKKFPVTSEKGNEYMVKVRESSIFKHHYEIYLYKKKKWYFSMEYFEMVNDMFMGQPHSYDARKYDYDIVAMVKKEVARHETHLERVDKNLTDREKIKKDFENWDGRL